MLSGITTKELPVVDSRGTRLADVMLSSDHLRNGPSVTPMVWSLVSRVAQVMTVSRASPLPAASGTPTQVQVQREPLALSNEYACLSKGTCVSNLSAQQ